MSSVGPWCLGGTLTLTIALSTFALAQQPAAPAAALDAMVATERAFAARALVIGWKQAFLEYFAADAIGFSDAGPVPALDDIRKAPDPPAGLRLEWEPRWGDIAASGELGWLTGPTRTTREGTTGARYGNYASVWRRTPSGRYEVLIDVGINTPAAVPFPEGFTRAPGANRYAGAPDAPRALAALQQADDALLMATRTAGPAAWRGQLAEGVRAHRPGQMPAAGLEAALAALGAEPPLVEGARLGAAVAASADLGYTWGRYVRPAPAAGASPVGGPASGGGGGGQASAAQAASPVSRGFYVRVWSRDRSGAWQVSLDVLQPQ